MVPEASNPEAVTVNPVPGGTLPIVPLPLATGKSCCLVAIDGPEIEIRTVATPAGALETILPDVLAPSHTKFAETAPVLSVDVAVSLAPQPTKVKTTIEIKIALINTYDRVNMIISLLTSEL